MKFLTSVLFSILIILISTESFAQEQEQEKTPPPMFPMIISTNYIIYAGYNFANLRVEEEEAFLINGGVHFGATVEFVQKGYEYLTLETGLFYMSKGCCFDGDTKGHLDLNYLELPINLKLILNSYSGLYKYFMTLGSYFSYGVGGSIHVEYEELGQIYHTNRSIIWGEDFKRFDFGFSTGIGIEIGHLIFSTNYSIGLINLNTHKDGSKITNDLLSVSIAYRL